MTQIDSVTYWDTSAIISVLFLDDHSSSALKFARAQGTHVMSSLAWTETHAVATRIERERVCEPDAIDTARAALTHGPWQQLHLEPEWALVEKLARTWLLRGADLWHLATAKTLAVEIPELAFLTFDQRLLSAAKGEGLLLPR